MHVLHTKIRSFDIEHLSPDKLDFFQLNFDSSGRGSDAKANGPGCPDDAVVIIHLQRHQLVALRGLLNDHLDQSPTAPLLPVATGERER